MATNEPELQIAPEKVRYIVVKARQLMGKDLVADPDSGSNATDDAMVDVLESHADDPVRQELSAFIGALDRDERTDLVALAWLGRGDGALDEWQALRDRADARSRRPTAAYLLGMPLLPDFLAEGLGQFGIPVAA